MPAKNKQFHFRSSDALSNFSAYNLKDPQNIDDDDKDDGE